VLMFFIHTSLVLMMSLDRLGPTNLVRRFYVRRVFRIYPLAIAAIMAALFFRIPPHFEPSYEVQPISVIAQNILLIQNLFKSPEIVGPMWTLPLEMQMYLALPFIYLAARRVRSFLGVAALLLTGFIVWAIDHKLSGTFNYWPIFPFAPWFFMGIAAYATMRIVKPRFASVYFVMALTLLVLGQIFVDQAIGGYRASWGMWAVGIVFALALPYFDDLPAGWLRVGAYIVAKYSYGIYLSHVPILWFSFHYLAAHAFVTQIATFCLLMFIVPFSAYHCIESPMIRLGARLADRFTASSCSPAGSRERKWVVKWRLKWWKLPVG
jgi:peptidoglycan/LPS O-acetylase OafA/YrhL